MVDLYDIQWITQGIPCWVTLKPVDENDPNIYSPGIITQVNSSDKKAKVKLSNSQ